MSAELQSILEVATEAALAAAASCASIVANSNPSKKRARGDLVTAADKASEAAILDLIRRHFPNHAFLAEESGRLEGAADTLISGRSTPRCTTTTPSIPVAAVSIGLLVQEFLN
jgi:myo-inositol-1(or 4)-monophosphatase